MSELDKGLLCQRVEESMTELLDGSASEELVEHIADCGRCRDARHDAERARALAIDSGADYHHPDDFEERVRSAATAPATLPQSQGAESTDAPTVRKPQAPAHTMVSATPTPPTTQPMTGATPSAVVAVSATPASPELETPKPAARPHVAPDRALRWLRRPRNTFIAGAVGAALAAASVAVVMRPTDGETEQAKAVAPWTGKVGKVSRAAGGEGGLVICEAAGSGCKPLAEGQSFEAGSMLRTDDRTRAFVELGDSTRVALDRSTELVLDASQNRRARLTKGAMVAEVKKIEGSTARVDLPRGHLEVLGTKFAVRTMGQAASVDVSRGAVLLVDEGERRVKVRSGEEGRSYPGVPPYATSAPRLGEALSWSETSEEEAVTVRGLGELKAKKPSDKEEKLGPVRLTSHKLKVRIVDGFARTEVEEVFTNTTDDVLEGIFRFPLPPDAQIEGLALDVDGKLEPGAFVDRDRAAAIWHGAIVSSGGQRQLREEIIWVPGPWKDPALLEWQRGGRFELRIFPIPKKGARRVVLTYTQAVPPVAGVRRYVYPLAHDPSGNLTVDDFTADIQVRGHDRELGVSNLGYELTRGTRGDADALSMTAQRFVPSGDLVVEYAVADKDSELTAWAYKPTVATTSAPQATPPVAQQVANTPRSLPLKTTTAPTLPTAPPEASFVALALRPKLPRRTEDVERAFSLVVDASRSMFGERYKRAVQLATRVVGELDRLDRFTVLACDTTCRPMPGGLRTPGYEAANEVKQFLEAISPEGGSDPAANVRDAATIGSQAEGRELRVVFIGDGTPTVGPIRPADLERASRDALPGGRGTLTTVAIGADADVESLAALARGGSGAMLPYVPGQKTGEAAYAVLGASYGMGLSNVSVALPDGLVEVAPTRLDTIAHGGESLVVARMTRDRVEGTVVVRGKVGSEDFEQRYPLQVTATQDAGNAFVPRLYAAKRIVDLERAGTAEARDQAVKLSSEFSVASRFTSLLVLESPAMFKAFGLDNSRRSPTWTGEDDVIGAKAKGDLDVGADEKAEAESADASDPFGEEAKKEGSADKTKARASAQPSFEPGTGTGQGLGGVGRGGGGRDAPMGDTAPGPMGTMAPPPPAPSPPLAIGGHGGGRAGRALPLPPKKPKTSPRRFDPDDDFLARDRRGMVPMRRVFERRAQINTALLIPQKASADAIAKAESAFALNENRREAVKELYTLLATAGQLDRAGDLAERWSQKESLDPEALTARADVAARRGQRDEAIRILGSVVDVRPSDVPSQKRLARLHRWAGRAALGCRHAIAIAQMRSKDAELLADAVHCGRSTGEGRLVEQMLLDADEATRKSAGVRLASLKDAADTLNGELKLEATWEGGADVDLALITPEGQRVSWLGAPTKAIISATDATSTNKEGLALFGSSAGEYVVEIVRASGEGPVRGTLKLGVPGDQRSIPFVLDGARSTIATVRVSFESRLVPLEAWRQF